MKKKLTITLIILGILLGVGAIIYSFTNKEAFFEQEQGSFSQSELLSMNKRIQTVMYSDENYHSYYGGCYLKNGNLVILVTKEFKDAIPEVKEAISQEEGVIVRDAKYTYLELKELNEELWDKRMELEESGSESTKAFLKDFNTGGVYEDENRVYVGIKDLTLWKQIRFRTLFQLWGDGRIMFESNSGVFLD